jgi:hypothetical protein
VGQRWSSKAQALRASSLSAGLIGETAHGGHKDDQSDARRRDAQQDLAMPVSSASAKVSLLTPVAYLLQCSPKRARR